MNDEVDKRIDGIAQDLANRWPLLSMSKNTYVEILSIAVLKGYNFALQMEIEKLNSRLNKGE